MKPNGGNTKDFYISLEGSCVGGGSVFYHLFGPVLLLFTRGGKYIAVSEKAPNVAPITINLCPKSPKDIKRSILFAFFSHSKKTQQQAGKAQKSW